MSITPQEIQVWEACRQGDTEAFTKLFRSYYAHIFQYGSKVTDDSALLEDCIQELFVDLWQSRPPAPIYSIKAYLIKATKFKILRAVRESKPVAAVHNLEEYHFELSHEQLLISNQESAEQKNKILFALRNLSNRQKEIIHLRYYQELSYGEICAVMDLNYQGARNLLSQSVKTLRKLYSADIFVVICFLFVFL